VEGSSDANFHYVFISVPENSAIFGLHIIIIL